MSDATTVGFARLGAGAPMKLAVNTRIAVTNESLAETLALAACFGAPRPGESSPENPTT